MAASQDPKPGSSSGFGAGNLYANADSDSNSYPTFSQLVSEAKRLDSAAIQPPSAPLLEINDEEEIALLRADELLNETTFFEAQSQARAIEAAHLSTSGISLINISLPSFPKSQPAPSQIEQQLSEFGKEPVSEIENSKAEEKSVAPTTSSASSLPPSSKQENVSSSASSSAKKFSFISLSSLPFSLSFLFSKKQKEASQPAESKPSSSPKPISTAAPAQTPSWQPSAITPPTQILGTHAEAQKPSSIIPPKIPPSPPISSPPLSSISSPKAAEQAAKQSPADFKMPAPSIPSLNKQEEAGSEVQAQKLEPASKPSSKIYPSSSLSSVQGAPIIRPIFDLSGSQPSFDENNLEEKNKVKEKEEIPSPPLSFTSPSYLKTSEKISSTKKEEIPSPQLSSTSPSSSKSPEKISEEESPSPSIPFIPPSYPKTAEKISSTKKEEIPSPPLSFTSPSYPKSPEKISEEESPSPSIPFIPPYSKPSEKISSTKKEEVLSSSSLKLPSSSTSERLTSLRALLDASKAVPQDEQAKPKAAQKSKPPAKLKGKKEKSEAKKEEAKKSKKIKSEKASSKKESLEQISKTSSPQLLEAADKEKQAPVSPKPSPREASFISSAPTIPTSQFASFSAPTLPYSTSAPASPLQELAFAASEVGQSARLLSSSVSAVRLGKRVFPTRSQTGQQSPAAKTQASVSPSISSYAKPAAQPTMPSPPPSSASEKKVQIQQKEPAAKGQKDDLASKPILTPKSPAAGQQPPSIASEISSKASSINSVQESASALTDEVYFSYAKRMHPWLYEIYSVGGMTLEEFRSKVKEKIEEDSSGSSGSQPPQADAQNQAFANLNKEIKRKFKK